MAKHKSLPYRPALDGLRGIAVAAVVIYHVAPSVLRGGWLGVDLFFVLSGFLITSLLLTEHKRWGRISLAGFWAARARRLLPSLIVVLLAVLAASMFLAQPGRRGAIATDVLATLAYVANWRFLLGDEQYFNAIAMPSPVRHAWSLSIEEQYYFFFPLVLTALLLMIRRRATLAAALVLAATASALWMAYLYVPGIDPSRVYYGTDTRIFELLIGAAAGALLGNHEFAQPSRWRIDRPLAILAWPAIVLFVLATIVVDENNPFVFRGGLAVICLILVVPVVTASSPQPSAFQRAFSWEPLRQLGLISYALYLWHWPVIVFASSDRIGLPPVLLAVLQIAVSVALAWLTVRFVERPIRQGGFRALVPRRQSLSLAVAGACVVLLGIGIAVLPRIQASAGEGQNLVMHEPDYLASPTPQAVALLGNSIPASVAAAFPAGSYPDLKVSAIVNFGCDPWSAAKMLGGAPQEPSEACAKWRNDWPTELHNTGSRLTLFFTPQSLVSDWQVDGKTLRFGSPEYVSWLEKTLGDLRTTTQKAGSPRFAVMNLACHRLPGASISPEVPLINDDRRVQRLNSIIAGWAKKSGVPVIDQYSTLCTGGYHDRINGIPLYKDTLHFSAESGAQFWTWLAPQIQKALE